MVLVVLLGLSWLCAPLGALVMDFNVKNSADAQGAQKGLQCVSDNDCGTRKFCIKPRNEKPFCATCRRTQRRCQHANMCCPGMFCVNNVCTLAEDVPPELKWGMDEEATGHSVQEDKCTRKPNIETLPVRMRQRKQKCLTSSDCGPRFCCARHFRTKVCKPLLLKGQVCSMRRYDTEQVQYMFQRCGCKAGLVCRQHRGRLHVCQKA